jgi:hypothetical protein
MYIIQQKFGGETFGQNSRGESGVGMILPHKPEEKDFM